MVTLKVSNEKCTGCRACEVACSYHHDEGIFNPRAASLQVCRNEKEGKFSIILYGDMPEEKREGRFPCDLCKDEPQPLCVRYCRPKAIAIEEIEQR